jgi:hypothetical protein
MISGDYLSDHFINNKEILLAHCMQKDHHICYIKKRIQSDKNTSSGDNQFCLQRIQASKPFTIETTAFIDS